MGICYHAIVEVAQPNLIIDPATGKYVDGPGKCWWVLVSEVNFNKNHELSRRLVEHPKVERGWPKDVSEDAKHEAEIRFIDQGRVWCDASSYFEALRIDPEKPGDFEDDVKALSGQAEALEAFLVVMAREPWVRGLRVLFWES
jgi:hypothetical protein